MEKAEGEDFGDLRIKRKDESQKHKLLYSVITINS